MPLFGKGKEKETGGLLQGYEGLSVEKVPTKPFDSQCEGEIGAVVRNDEIQLFYTGITSDISQGDKKSQAICVSGGAVYELSVKGTGEHLVLGSKKPIKAGDATIYFRSGDEKRVFGLTIT